MSSTNDCLELARRLNAQYVSPNAFDPTVQSLPSFLNVTGVLITMCLGFISNCSKNFGEMDHWSGSWIQKSTTGVRVFGNQGVGVVLKPEKLQLTCLYPLDAATDDRGNLGCGPLPYDIVPRWQRLGWKAFAWYVKTKHFRRVPWDEIPCSQFIGYFFDIDGDDDNNTTDVGPPVLLDHDDHWKTYSWFLKNQVEDVMGHTVCYDDTIPTFDDDSAMLLYFGQDPWQLHEWNTTMHVMKTIIDRHPTSRGIWNEVVFEIPSGSRLTRDMVHAVFYINDDFRAIAKFQAQKLGGVPLLELYGIDADPDSSHHDHVFRCDTANAMIVAAQ